MESFCIQFYNAWQSLLLPSSRWIYDENITTRRRCFL